MSNLQQKAKLLAKELYMGFPFKRELFVLLKRIWTPSEEFYKHLHFRGVITIPVVDNKNFKMFHYGYKIENSLFWAGLTGGWERQSLKLWLALCQQSHVIADIGANTGVYALIAASVNPSARVFAFEPVHRVFRKLEQNIELNHFEKVLAYEKAVSNFDGLATIYDPGSEHLYSVTVNRNLAPTGTPVTETNVQTVSLNTFVRNEIHQPFDLMKIDVETHEAEVLEGYSDYLRSTRPTLLIEVLNEVVAQQIQLILQDLDYLYFNIDENGGVRQAPHLGKSDDFNFLICQREIAARLGLVSD